jgi:hypothetical protein
MFARKRKDWPGWNAGKKRKIAFSLGRKKATCLSREKPEHSLERTQSLENS